MASKTLRGNRFRKVRRYLKHHPDSYVEAMIPGAGGKIAMIIFGPPTYGDVAYDLPDSHAIEIPPVVIDAGTIDIHQCSVCGAKGSDPCVTKSGKKAKQNHAGRDTI